MNGPDIRSSFAISSAALTSLVRAESVRPKLSAAACAFHASERRLAGSTARFVRWCCRLDAVVSREGHQAARSGRGGVRAANGLAPA
jgi:hypothetical protein